MYLMIDTIKDKFVTGNSVTELLQKVSLKWNMPKEHIYSQTDLGLFQVVHVSDVSLGVNGEMREFFKDAQVVL